LHGVKKENNSLETAGTVNGKLRQKGSASALNVDTFFDWLSSTNIGIESYRLFSRRRN